MFGIFVIFSVSIFRGTFSSLQRELGWFNHSNVPLNNCEII